MSVCELQMTPDEAEKIRQCESVIIREYELADGRRLARAVAWGDAEEMKRQAQIIGFFLLPVGVEIVAQVCMPVSEVFGTDSQVCMPVSEVFGTNAG